MTRVCLLGDPDVVLRYELLSRETSREALSTYALEEPFQNSVAVETVSLGAAVSLLNDLQWYIVRFVDEALVLEPSVDDEEWLSRDLARQIRAKDVDPEETDEFLKLYGVEEPDPGTNRAARDATTPDAETESKSVTASVGEDAGSAGGSPGAGEATQGETGRTTYSSAPPRLVEPLYVRRVDGTVPEYDLRDVDETVVVRVTESEFET